MHIEIEPQDFDILGSEYSFWGNSRKVLSPCLRGKPTMNTRCVDMKMFISWYYALLGLDVHTPRLSTPWPSVPSLERVRCMIAHDLV